MINHRNLRRFFRGSILAGLGLLTLFGSGCATHYTHGEASHALFAAQVVNRAAPTDPTPAYGMAGLIGEIMYYRRYATELLEPDEEEEKQSGENTNKAEND